MLNKTFRLTFLPVLVALLFGSCGNAQHSNGVVENANVNAFEQGMYGENVILLDVRMPKEVAQGHIEGAEVMDFYSADFDSKLKTLDSEKEVYVYCRSGGRSYKTAEKLAAMGFKKVVNLDGGIGAWNSAGKPTVK